MTARVRWHGDATPGPLHATVNGYVAGTLIPAYLNQWVLTEETLTRFPTLYGIGPRALSTWRAKLATAIREYGCLDQPPVATR